MRLEIETDLLLLFFSSVSSVSSISFKDLLSEERYSGWSVTSKAFDLSFSLSTPQLTLFFYLVSSGRSYLIKFAVTFIDVS
jgi:hypothetical protein